VQSHICDHVHVSAHEPNTHSNGVQDHFEFEAMRSCSEKPPQLDHLTGIRGILATWVVCGHYLPRMEHGLFNAIACRSWMAVDVFIILSGFVTHWSYSARLKHDVLTIKQYLIKRIAPVVLTTYLAMLLSLCLALYNQEDWLPGFWPIIGCFGFVVHWVKPSAWCPAPPSWTIEALIPCWILYPWLRRGICVVEGRWSKYGLIFGFMFLWVVSFGPVVVIFAVQGFKLHWTQFATDFFWPPSQFADFAMGAIAAALAEKKHAEGSIQNESLVNPSGVQERYAVGRQLSPRKCVKSMIPDILCACVIAPFLILPWPDNWGACQRDWSAMLNHALAPAHATWMYASSMYEAGGVVAQFLRCKALVALGKYAFEAYLFQWPLCYVFKCALGVSLLSMEQFMMFFLMLWLLAGIYVEFVAPPLTRRLLQILGADGQKHSHQGQYIGVNSTAKD